MVDAHTYLLLATTGHFYQCPNGHPYTIGEVKSFYLVEGGV